MVDLASATSDRALLPDDFREDMKILMDPCYVDSNSTLLVIVNTPSLE